MSQSFKLVRYKALDSKVLVVAVEGYANDWACYIGAVEGKNHNIEYKQVMKHGSKLHTNLARLLFPEFDRFLYRE